MPSTPTRPLPIPIMPNMQPLRVPFVNRVPYHPAFPPTMSSHAPQHQAVQLDLSPRRRQVIPRGPPHAMQSHRDNGSLMVHNGSPPCMQSFANIDVIHGRCSDVDYIVVVDFEATCDAVTSQDFKPEIIQFPAIILNTRTLDIVDSFDTYVRPVLNPKLSKFCTELTGITQAQVDAAPLFPEAMNLFIGWLISRNIGITSTFFLATDSSVDMGRFLLTQCQISKIPYPVWANQWINIRNIFSSVFHTKWHSLPKTAEYLGLSMVGTHHNGLHDSANIAIILTTLLTSGGYATANERILLSKQEQKKNAQVQNQTGDKWLLPSVAPLYPGSSNATFHVVVQKHFRQVLFDNLDTSSNSGDSSSSDMENNSPSPRVSRNLGSNNGGFRGGRKSHQQNSRGRATLYDVIVPHLSTTELTPSSGG